MKGYRYVCTSPARRALSASAWLLLSMTLGAQPASAQQFFDILVDNTQTQATCPIGSSAMGSGTATLDLGTLEFSWNITFGNNASDFDNGLLDQGAEVAAHFHDAPPGLNGPVVIPLSLGSPKVGSTFLTAAPAADLQAGNWYVNMHSQSCSAGEIRGQVAINPALFADGFESGNTSAWSTTVP